MILQPVGWVLPTKLHYEGFYKYSGRCPPYYSNVNRTELRLHYCRCRFRRLHGCGTTLRKRLVQMPGSHKVMFSNPVRLAEKIIVAGRD